MKRKSSTLEPAVRRSGRPNKGVHQEQGGRVPVEIAKRSASIACQKEQGELVAASNVPVTKKRKNALSAAAHVDQGFRNPFDTRTAADLEGQTFRNTPKSVEQSVTRGGRLTVLNASPLTTIGSTSPNINLPSLDVPSTDHREQVSLQVYTYRSIDSQATRFLAVLSNPGIIPRRVRLDVCALLLPKYLVTSFHTLLFSHLSTRHRKKDHYLFFLTLILLRLHFAKPRFFQTLQLHRNQRHLTEVRSLHQLEISHLSVTQHYSPRIWDR